MLHACTSKRSSTTLFSHVHEASPEGTQPRALKNRPLRLRVLGTALLRPFETHAVLSFALGTVSVTVSYCSTHSPHPFVPHCLLHLLRPGGSLCHGGGWGRLPAPSPAPWEQPSISKRGHIQLPYNSGSSPEGGAPTAPQGTLLVHQLFPPLPSSSIVSLPDLPTCASWGHDPSNKLPSNLCRRSCVGELHRSLHVRTSLRGHSLPVTHPLPWWQSALLPRSHAGLATL